MRIVSLLSGATETICALGAQHMLVGRSHECDHPADVRALPICTRPAFDVTVSSLRIDQEVRRRLHCGLPLFEVDNALIVSLKPDLILTQAHCEVCAVTPDDIAGGRCAQVLTVQIGSLEGIFAGMRTLAQAIDRLPQYRRWLAAARRRLRGIDTRLKGKRRPSVVALEWTDPPYPMGNWGPELISLAHARPLLGTVGAHSRKTPWERVTSADPQFLIIAPCGYDLARTLGEIPILEAKPGWFSLSAVRQGNVFLADGNRYFNRASPSVIDTVELVADMVHNSAAVGSSAWQRYRPSCSARPNKKCSACGVPFTCGGPNCWCEKVQLSLAQAEKLRRRFSDCLCPACLKKAAAKRSKVRCVR